MEAKVDPGLLKRVKELTIKEYLDRPQPELLIAIPNNQKDVDYEVNVSTREFTSLCPLSSSQPDYATIEIDYIPKEKLVELKSLKLLLVSFRTVAVFHEEIPGLILKALVDLLQPSEMYVTGIFTIRGGLSTKVVANYCGDQSGREI